MLFQHETLHEGGRSVRYYPRKPKNQFTTNLWPTLQVFSINSSYLLLVLFKISQDVWTLEQRLYNWKWSSWGIWIPGEYLYDVIFSGKQFCFASFFPDLCGLLMEILLSFVVGAWGYWSWVCAVWCCSSSQRIFHISHSGSTLYAQR